MTGTLLNAWAVLAGTAVGLSVTREISAVNQNRLKIGMGVCTVYVGLSTVWGGLNGTIRQILGQLATIALALVLGNVVGKLLRLQRSANALGRYAREQFSRAAQSKAHPLSDGFVTCAILFCVGPIAFLGATQDGLAGDYRLLLIKGLMDGLAAMAFARTFGWGVLLSALPLLAYQGSVTLLARRVQPFLLDPGLLDSIFVTEGFLICCIALIIFEIKKVRLADYLPSLVIAPLLAWLFG